MASGPWRGYLGLILLLLIRRISAQFYNNTCKIFFEALYAGDIENTLGYDPFYRHSPRGLIQPDLIENRTAEGIIPYVVITRRACLDVCGDQPDFHGPDEAFQILTTWVLPCLALFSNLPFESMKSNKFRATLAALVNWIGSPQSAFTTTMFNIYQIRNCASYAGARELQQYRTDSFFVLSCINQYYFERYATKRSLRKRLLTKTSAKELEDERSLALFYGLFRPLASDNTPAEQPDIEETRFLLAVLAHQLRLLRRKNVYPLMVNVIWFFIAFALSLVLAFAHAGDNTEAHNLGLGIALVWVPTLVVMTIIDRNPISPARCRTLIERWLYNVNQIIKFNQEVAIPQARRHPCIRWWQPSDEFTLTIDDFVGQGRRLRHCGVTNTVLERLDRCRIALDASWREKSSSSNKDETDGNASGMVSQAYLRMLPESTKQQKEEQRAVAIYRLMSENFECDLIKRPTSWWICWACSGLSVGLSLGMALALAYNTPMVGFGCRSLSFFIFWVLSSVSWVFQAVWQEPSRAIRRISTTVNAAAFVWLMIYMLIQTINGFNNCTCHALMGISGGGYLDFQNGDFYKEHYHVVTWWAITASVGPWAGFIPIAWTLRQWSKSAMLWKCHEGDHFTKILPGPLPGRPWDGTPLVMLT